MISVNIHFNKKDVKNILDMPKEFKAGILRGVRKAVIYAEGESKKRFNTPGNLHVRSGHLRRSITSGVDKRGNSVMGWIGTNVIYGRIHEEGGTILPKKGKYLRFPINGSWRTVKKVVIPERPFLQPAIEENIGQIGNIIVKGIIQEMD